MLLLLEYIPLIGFFAAFKLYDIYVATGVLIVATFAQFVIMWAKDKTFPKKYFAFFMIALVLGGLTIFFRNDLFIKWKVTVIYFIMGSSLLISRYLFKKNLVEKALGQISEQAEIPSFVWDRCNIATACLLYFISTLNIILAYSLSQDAWVNFKTFGTMAITFVFIIGLVFYLSKYFPDDEEEVTTTKDN